MEKTPMKYNGELDLENYKKYVIKGIFKILPLKEEKKDWNAYLDGFLVELNGMNSLVPSLDLNILTAKLEGLRQVEEHNLFRKIIFDSIDLTKKIK